MTNIPKIREKERVMLGKVTDDEQKSSESMKSFNSDIVILCVTRICSEEL